MGLFVFALLQNGLAGGVVFGWARHRGSFATSEILLGKTDVNGPSYVLTLMVDLPQDLLCLDVLSLFDQPATLFTRTIIKMGKIPPIANMRRHAALSSTL
jgi:hypothetical protein